MSDRSRYYIVGAFLLGIAVTAAYNKRLVGEKNDAANSHSLLAQQQNLLLQLAKVNDLEELKKGLLGIERSLENGKRSIKEGIEGCIGNTPLIKIKSLSEYTGCDILAKAEVCKSMVFTKCLTDV